MTTLVGLRDPLTILVTDFTSPDKLNNDLLLLSVTTKLNKCSLFQTLWEPLMNRKD